MSAPDDGDGDDVVVLGRAGVRTGYLLLLAGVALTGLLASTGTVAGLYWPVLFTGATAWQLFVRGGDEVRLERDALVVRSRGAARRYAWADVLEVSWRPTGSWLTGPGPVLRVRGGPFDEPGPNLPGQVASLPVFGRRANVAARQALRAAAARRGIRFDAAMERDILLGRRRPQDPERGVERERPDDPGGGPGARAGPRR